MEQTIDYKIKNKEAYSRSDLSLTQERSAMERSRPYETFLEQFLEPPVFVGGNEAQNLIWIPTFCTIAKVPVIDDVDKLLSSMAKGFVKILLSV